jgi:hypothetical protein
MCERAATLTLTLTLTECLTESTESTENLEERGDGFLFHQESELKIIKI